MNRRQLLILLSGTAAASPRILAQAEAPLVEVVRDPTCGCCLDWVAHLERAGFRATVSQSPAMDAVKDARGIPKAARSCHTATVEGYVLEGHVPAVDVKRLLKDRPDVLGLAVPGMPIGSPGMESSSGRVEPYDVLTFDEQGQTKVFASYGRP